MWLSVAVFLMLACLILMAESQRRSDLLSIFVFIFSLQIVLPGIFLPVIIALLGGGAYLGNFFLDRVYHEPIGLAAALSASMSFFFVIALYGGFYLSPSRAVNWFCVAKKINISRWRLFCTLAVGVFSMAYLLFLMPGNSVADKYFSLVLFRAQHESVFDEARNFITSNLFSLTQTFAISTVFLFFYLKDKYERVPIIAWIVFLLLMIFMATFAVSRRIVLIQFFIVYFSFILMTGRWLLGYVVVSFPLALLWLGFGKDLLLQIPNFFSGDELNLKVGVQGFWLPVLNAFSSLGISLNSSWATFLFMGDVPPRFGVDHVLSALRFLPLGVFGVDEDQLYGPRIVRVSTEVFVDSHALDIPPGLIGQMWIDFRVFGPVIWGLFFGFGLRVVQVAFSGYRKTWASCGVFSVVVFFVALPINSGSLDFNFSVDMFFLLLFLFWVIKVDRGSRSLNHDG